LITRETQFEKPDEDEEDEDDEVVCIDSNGKKEENKGEQPPPPLPPPQEEEAKPPLPPEITLPPLPAATKTESQVEDMDLSEEETEATPIETSSTAATGDKAEVADHLSDALSSFYTDIATIDDATSKEASKETTPTPPPQVESPAPMMMQQPGPGENSPSAATLSDERSSSPLSYGETPEERRKRKTKISSGLSMKKKNVGSLVAKWQNIQQEVKRNQ